MWLFLRNPLAPLIIACVIVAGGAGFLAVDAYLNSYSHLTERLLSNDPAIVSSALQDVQVSADYVYEPELVDVLLKLAAGSQPDHVKAAADAAISRIVKYHIISIRMRHFRGAQSAAWIARAGNIAVPLVAADFVVNRETGERPEWHNREAYERLLTAVLDWPADRICAYAQIIIRESAISSLSNIAASARKLLVQRLHQCGGVNAVVAWHDAWRMEGLRDPFTYPEIELATEREAPDLVLLLEHRDLWISRRAAKALGGLGARDAIPRLVEVLARVGQDAAEALDKLGWQPQADKIGVLYWLAKKDKDRLNANTELTDTVLAEQLASKDLWENALLAVSGLGRTTLLGTVKEQIEKPSNVKMLEAMLVLDENSPLYAMAWRFVSERRLITAKVPGKKGPDAVWGNW